VKAAIFHPAAIVAIRSFPAGVRRELGKAIFELQKGVALGMPLSRPMPSIVPGGVSWSCRAANSTPHRDLSDALLFQVAAGRAGDSRFHQESSSHFETRRGLGKETVKEAAP